MKSYLLQLLVLFIVVAAFTTDGTAKDKHLPLPPQIVAAKTVYIDNQSGITKLGDRCYTEIQKWGRFQVVQDRKQADLILLLSAREYVRGYVTSGGGTTGTINSSGSVYTTSSGDHRRNHLMFDERRETESKRAHRRLVDRLYRFDDIHPGLEQFTGESEQRFAGGSEGHSATIPLKYLDVEGVF